MEAAAAMTSCHLSLPLAASDYCLQDVQMHQEQQFDAPLQKSSSATSILQNFARFCIQETFRVVHRLLVLSQNRQDHSFHVSIEAVKVCMTLLKIA